jgi:hypothetical protein
MDRISLYESEDGGSNPPASATKACSCCGLNQSVYQFNVKLKATGQRHSYCIECGKKKTKKHYADNKEYYVNKARKWEQENLERALSIDVRETLRQSGNFDESQVKLAVDKLIQAREGGACEICGATQEERLNVDHDHTTGRFRGLLCRDCNLGLGRFKDNSDLLRKAIDYLNAAII